MPGSTVPNSLSTLDNLTAAVYPSPVHFFPLEPEANPLQLYENCKRGLARYLYAQPHLSGRFIKDETGRNSIEILPAPKAGATFKHCDHRDDGDMPSYSEFRKFGWPFADGDQDGLSKLRPTDFPSVQTGDPVLAPQFNVIKGGIVLVMSISHAMCDLVQCMDLMQSWAQNTKAVANARAHNRPEPPLPEKMPAYLLDRSHLVSNAQPEFDLDKIAAGAEKLEHWDLLDPRDPEKMAENMQKIFTKARLTDEDIAASPEDDLREISVSVWTFPASSIQKLKRVALSSSPEGMKLSSIDCLTGFAWQRFITAKYAPGSSGPEPIPDTTRIVYAGSVRQRLTPPLPLNYLPTCVDLFPACTTIDTQQAHATPESLARAAMAIRGSNTNWSESKFRDMLSIAQMHPLNPGIIPKGPLDALATDHTRSGQSVLEDWGTGLGTCEAFREPYIGRVPPRGEITLMPMWKNGEVSVMFAGERIVMERLKMDDSLGEMASCQFLLGDFVKMAAQHRRTSKL